MTEQIEEIEAEPSLRESLEVEFDKASASADDAPA